MTPSPGPLAGVFNGRDYRTCVPDGQLVFLDLKSLAVAVPPPAQLFAVVSESEAEWPTVLTRVKELNNLAVIPSGTYTRGEAIPFTRYSVRTVFIQDGPGIFPADVLATMPRYGQPWKELYRYKGETLEQAQARWIVEAADLEKRWGYDLGAVLQCYQMGVNPPLYTVAQVEAIAAAGIAHLNARGPRWKLALNFAWDRADGAQVPALATLQSTICSQSPGWPTLEPVDHPIPPPPVRVASVVPLC